MRTGDLSVIIPVQNEELTISEVLHEVNRLKPLEIIVILNGSTDKTGDVCKSFGCKIIDYPFSIGNDVGRAIGACHAKGDILLFLDGDIPIPHMELYPLIHEIEQGNHIALNNLAWTTQLTPLPHITTISKMAVNHMLSRPSLVTNSLLAIPHAISKAAVQEIGWWNLSDPILAQAIAIHKNLSIVAPISIDVIKKNRTRETHFAPSENSPYPESTSRILGDHLVAMDYFIKQKGPRGGFTDGHRKRKFLNRYVPPSYYKRAKRSAIIPVGEEKRTIKDVIRSVRLAGVDEIIVVANGADRETIMQAQREGVLLIPFNQSLGHNVGRAIGAAYATGDVCLFVDGDFVVSPSDLFCFIKAVENGVDVALNDLESLLYRFQTTDTISTVKYFLNIVMRRKDLLNNSLTAVPHAMHRRVIQKIGYKSLMIPPLAQVKAIHQGFNVQAVHYVDVVQPNRIRDEHVPKNGRIQAFDRIIGDHVEALAYFLQITNKRGYYSDGNRKRELLL